MQGLRIGALLISLALSQISTARFLEGTGGCAAS
jgi:hypothetical protein